jgi:hypothetical protein
MTEDPTSPGGPREDQAPDASETPPSTEDDEGTASSLLEEALAALEKASDSDSEDEAIPEEAIFSPDEPIVREGEEPGVVTGMGGVDARDAAAQGGEGDLAWEIRHAAHIMTGLAKALQDQGMDALKVDPETEPMDAVLRSFIAGYLVGRTDSAE